MECPKCGLVQPDTGLECLRCGIIFAKAGVAPPSTAAVQEIAMERTQRPSPRMALESAEASSAEDTAPEDPEQFEDEPEPVPEPRHMDRTDWLVFASGPVFAVLIMAVPLLNHIFMTLVILTHEMGHALTGWLFGYPSLPAFDLRYGGGVTATFERSAVLLILVYAGFAFLLWTYRKNRSTLIVLFGLLALHIALSATDWHNVVFLFMGHGMELIIAGIFFYRALSGAAVVHAAERPLYCIISWFIVLSDLRFAHRLVFSAHERGMYEEAKGGGHWMDFSRIAEDYLHTDLKRVALVFLLCCLLPLVVGFLAFRYQEYLRSGVVKLWAREPAATTD